MTDQNDSDRMKLLPTIMQMLLIFRLSGEDKINIRAGNKIF
jgi:hypothetical protein